MEISMWGPPGPRDAGQHLAAVGGLRYHNSPRRAQLPTPVGGRGSMNFRAIEFTAYQLCLFGQVASPVCFS